MNSQLSEDDCGGVTSAVEPQASDGLKPLPFLRLKKLSFLGDTLDLEDSYRFVGNMYGIAKATNLTEYIASLEKPTNWGQNSSDTQDQSQENHITLIDPSTFVDPIFDDHNPKTLQSVIISGHEGIGKTCLSHILFYWIQKTEASEHFFPLLISAPELFRSIKALGSLSAHSLFQAFVQNLDPDSQKSLTFELFVQQLQRKPIVLLVDNLELVEQQHLVKFAEMLLPRNTLTASTPPVARPRPSSSPVEQEVAETCPALASDDELLLQAGLGSIVHVSSRVILFSRNEGLRLCRVPQPGSLPLTHPIRSLAESYVFTSLLPGIIFNILSTTHIDPLLQSWSFSRDLIQPGFDLIQLEVLSRLRQSIRTLWPISVISPVLLFLLSRKVYHKVVSLSLASSSSSSSSSSSNGALPSPTKKGKDNPSVHNDVSSFPQITLHSLFDSLLDEVLTFGTPNQSAIQSWVNNCWPEVKLMFSLIGFLSHRMEDPFLLQGSTIVNGHSSFQLGIQLQHITEQMTRILQSDQLAQSCPLELRELMLSRSLPVSLIVNEILALFDSLCTTNQPVDGKIKFRHRLIQEYLAAAFLASPHAQAMLSAFSNTIAFTTPLRDSYEHPLPNSQQTKSPSPVQQQQQQLPQQQPTQNKTVVILIPFRWNYPFFLTNLWWERVYLIGGYLISIEKIGKAILCPQEFISTKLSRKKKVHPSLAFGGQTSQQQQDVSVSNWLRNLHQSGIDREDIGLIRFQLLLRIFSYIRLQSIYEGEGVAPTQQMTQFISLFGESCISLLKSTTNVLLHLEPYPVNFLSAFSSETGVTILTKCIELFTTRSTHHAITLIRSFIHSPYFSDKLIDSLYEWYCKGEYRVRIGVFMIFRTIDDNSLEKKCIKHIIHMLGDEDPVIRNEVSSYLSRVAFDSYHQARTKHDHSVDLLISKDQVTSTIARAIKWLEKLLSPSDRSNQTDDSLATENQEQLFRKNGLFIKYLSIAAGMLEQADPGTRFLAFVAFGSKTFVTSQTERVHEKLSNRSVCLMLCRELSRFSHSQQEQIFHEEALCEFLRFELGPTTSPPQQRSPSSSSPSTNRALSSSPSSLGLMAAASSAEDREEITTPGEYHFTLEVSRLIEATLGESCSCWVSSIVKLLSFNERVVRRVVCHLIQRLPSITDIESFICRILSIGQLEETFGVATKATKSSAKAVRELLYRLQEQLLLVLIEFPEQQQQQIARCPNSPQLFHLIEEIITSPFSPQPSEFLFSLRITALQTYPVLLRWMPQHTNFKVLADCLIYSLENRDALIDDVLFPRFLLSLTESWERILRCPLFQPTFLTEEAIIATQKLIARFYSIPWVQSFAYFIICAAFELLSKSPSPVIQTLFTTPPPSTIQFLSLSDLLLYSNAPIRQAILSFLDSHPGITFSSTIPALLQLIKIDKEDKIIPFSERPRAFLIRAAATSALGIIGRRGCLSLVATQVASEFLISSHLKPSQPLTDQSTESAIRALALLGKNRRRNIRPTDHLSEEECVSAEIVSNISCYLNSDVSRIQLAALDALSSFGDSSVLFYCKIAEKLLSSDSEIRETAENTLKSIGKFVHIYPEELRPFFDRCLSEHKYYVRLAVIKTIEPLGAQAIKFFSKHVAMLLRDFDKSVQLDSIRTVRLMVCQSGEELDLDVIDCLTDTIMDLVLEKKREVLRESLKLARSNNLLSQRVADRVNTILLSKPMSSEESIQALSLIGSLNAIYLSHIPLICSLCSMDDPKIVGDVSNMISSLGVNTVKFIPRIIVKLLSPAFPGIKRKLIRTLRDHEDELRRQSLLLEVQDDLFKMAHDSDISIKRKAAELLVNLARILGEVIPTPEGKKGIDSGGLSLEGKQRLAQFNLPSFAPILRNIITELTRLFSENCTFTRKDAGMCLAEVGAAIPSSINNILDSALSVDDNSPFVVVWRQISVRWKILISLD